MKKKKEERGDLKIPTPDKNTTPQQQQQHTHNSIKNITNTKWGR